MTCSPKSPAVCPAGECGAHRPAILRRTLPPAERAVHDLLGGEPVHVDDLAGRSALPIPDLLVILLSLEMKNLVSQLPGKYFIRRV